MSDNLDSIGEKIKRLRTAKGWTLREMGQRTELSTGYLSLVERDLTSLNISSLQSIATALEIDIGVFFTPPVASASRFTRSHEQSMFFMEHSSSVYFSRASSLPEGVLEPIVVLLKPERSRGEINLVSHEGEEFGFVLEGIVTVFIDNTEQELFPEDSYHIMAKDPHAVLNFSNRLSRVLMVNTPRTFSPS